MTALEYLVEELQKRSTDLTMWHNDILVKVKEMEKKQIIDAFKSGDCNGTFETINAEYYYNQKFNK